LPAARDQERVVDLASEGARSMIKDGFVPLRFGLSIAEPESGLGLDPLRTSSDINNT
jgi:hypothetical protein